MSHIIGRLITDPVELCLLTGKQYVGVMSGGLTIDGLGETYVYAVF